MLLKSAVNHMALRRWFVSDKLFHCSNARISRMSNVLVYFFKYISMDVFGYLYFMTLITGLFPEGNKNKMSNSKQSKILII